MDEQPQVNALASAFPTPPPFWRNFTPENLARIEKLYEAKKALDPEALTAKGSGSGSGSANLVRILDLPSEIRCLQPPEVPLDGRYRCFGDIYNLNDELPSLEEQGITQLYSPPETPTGSGKQADRAFILKRIAKSLLLNFLELVGIMSVNPEQYAEKIQDLRTLFINFHHLLNEYRPHQARESLILMMQDQLETSKAETEGIMKMKGDVEGILEALGKIGLGDGVELQNSDVSNNTEMPVEEGLDVWQELDREFR